MARPRRTLTSSFYARPTLTVLADLIGKVLVHDTAAGPASGIIVEAEAYIGEDDPACHAAPGPTPRNAPLYGPPGRAYVYLNYGLHCLVNAVTEDEGVPAAVLIRALAPLDGVALMRERRLAARRPGTAPNVQAGRTGRVIALDDLCRGPGNLTVALGISLAQNRVPLTSGALRIEDRGIVPGPIAWSPRIGISVGTDRAWRGTWEAHAAISGPRRR